jgi:molybdopterin molybdotransferase
MVRRLVKNAFLDCGDELVTPPDTCDPHQVPASNAAMLAAMLDRLPATAMISAPVPDRIDAFVNALDAARDADVIVTTGGASVGDHDVTRPALEQWGAQLDFWRVAIKPGKPLLVARRGSQIVLGLPGNPVSAFVTAFFFLLPLVRAMSGAAQCLPKPETLPLAADLPPSGGRREFVRGVVTEGGALALASQDSGGLLAVSQATILIERPPQASAARSGTPVPVYRLQNGGIA